MQFTQWLNQNQWLNVVFLVLAIASIFLSIYLYIKSKREKIPYYNVRTFQLIEDKLSTIKAVEVLYKGQKIDNLALSKIAVWNKGKDTINFNDVAPKDPLRITIDPKHKILTAEIIHVTTEANNFSVMPNLEKGEVIINFDYFHTNEGVVIQIYHTGRSNDDVKLYGTIKGVPKVILLPSTSEVITDSVVNRVLSPFPEPDKIKPRLLRYIYVGIIFVIILPIAFVLLPVDKLIAPMRKIPREFELLD